LKKEIEKYFDRLWPICRSLTGDGNRETLKILSEIADIKVTEVPSGTKCFDWNVPPEWNVKDAWIKDSNGKKIIDFKKNNLHLLGYSEKFNGKLNLDELKNHLHTLPDQPNVIPYLTSYYSSRWGFCLTHKQFKGLKKGEYEVFIDVKKDPKGSMTVGEAVIPGQSKKEILLSTYICHPSMANNELSGPLVSAFLFKELKKKKDRRYTYRFLFLPETIGPIWYLSKYGNELKKKLQAGYVLTCIGDKGNFTYKKSRAGNTLADRAAELTLSQNEKKYLIEDFFPTGSDERQYCSPGFDLPVGSLMRTRYGKYKEYHTSSDNKDFISFDKIEKSVNMYMEILYVLEGNRYYLNTKPYCEPQLGKRGLYPTLGSQKATTEFVNAMMWVLNLSDGANDLISISIRSGLKFNVIEEAARRLHEKGLLKIYLK